MSILGSLTGVKYWCGEDEDEDEDEMVPGKHSYPKGVPGPKQFGNHCHRMNSLDNGNPIQQ